MNEGIPFDPRNMTPALGEELLAIDIVEEVYGLTKGNSKGMGLIAIHQMREVGDKRIADYTLGLFGNFRATGVSDFAVGMEWGWSAGYLYHHQLALIRKGIAPILSLPAIVAWQDESDTEKGLQAYMRANLPIQASTEWVMREIRQAEDSLGLALGGLIAQIAIDEGILNNIDARTAILSGSSRINRLFQIHNSLPPHLQDMTE